MDCQAVRELYVEALVAGRAALDEVDRHVAACSACRETVQGLAGTWSVLAALPLLEPTPQVAQRLHRRMRWERVRDGFTSIDAWQRAALGGVAGFVVSVLLSLLVPYETMIAFCEAVAPRDLPGPIAFLAAGLLYGLLPMLVGTAVETRSRRVVGLFGALEAAAVFMAVLVPYVLLRCGEFPLPLLTGFVMGIGLGAAAGSVGAAAVIRRQAWAS